MTRIGIPSFIMTLAMMQIGAGISAVLVRGQIAYSVPSLILTLGSKSIGGVPWIIIVAAVFLGVAHLVLTYTRFGRYVYMVGGNREAAEYSGVNVRLIVGAVMVGFRPLLRCSMVVDGRCSRVLSMIGVAYFRQRAAERIRHVPAGCDRRRCRRRHEPVWRACGGIGNTIVRPVPVLGVINNGLDYVKIDSFLKILIRGVILLIALIVNIYAERLRTARTTSGG